MQFTSLDFLAFLLVVLISYYSLPSRFKNHILLIASYAFYLTFDYRYFFILIFSTSATYFFAILSKKGRAFAVLGIISNIFLLFFFKYYFFVMDILKNIFSLPLIEIILPVGISFYVFQNIAYLADVSAKKARPERNILIFALSVSFFPKILSGPIERSTYIQQFLRKRSFDLNGFLKGIEQMLFGFFKKIVIADRLAIVVNQVFGNIELYQGPALFIAVLFYTFQIYADFSGYTDIALGIARLFGIELTKNFKRPYLSKNLSDFWRRWHISLSAFIRDYIYIPLGGSRNGTIRTVINLMISFTLCGLWHGANYTFVLFGIYYGVLISIYNMTRKFYERIPNIIQISLTLILVFIGWIFFRSSSISEAIYIFKNLLIADFSTQGIALGVTWTGLIIDFLLIAGLMLFEVLEEFFGFDFSSRNNLVKNVSYILILLMIILFGAFNQVSFVYSQF